MRVDPTVAVTKVVTGVSALNITAGDLQDTRAILADEQAQLERVGIFGTLQVGFVASAVMAILALWLYSYAALQARLFEFGVLRAIGLKHSQVMWQVALEYVALTLYCGVVGAVLGWASALLFVPFLRVPASSGSPPPPLLPLIDQGGMFELTLAFTSWMVLAQVVMMIYALRRSRFEALRIGHQA
ncbi:MAG: ABC transporter permease, partial [Caldilineaceae bacterium]|nr:ABC transporter permease [Caldilineaceae bacterium]